MAELILAKPEEFAAMVNPHQLYSSYLRKERDWYVKEIMKKSRCRGLPPSLTAKVGD
jgi:hypothetical protein